MLLFQRSPLLVSVERVRLVFSPTFAHVGKFLAPASITFGGMHSLTGATGTVIPVNPFRNPVSARVGESFTWVFKTDGERSKSYTVTDLPEGLRYSGIVQGGISSIGGLPEEEGVYTIGIKGWRLEGEKGESTDIYRLVLKVEPAGSESLPGSYAAWVKNNGLVDDDVDLQADPDGDGLSNLFEYAFGLDPAARIRPESDGILSWSSSLETSRKSPSPQQVRFRRRRTDAGSDVNYNLQFSEDLSNWISSGLHESTRPLDEVWRKSRLRIQQVRPVAGGMCVWWFATSRPTKHFYGEVRVFADWFGLVFVTGQNQESGRLRMETLPDGGSFVGEVFS